MSGEAAKPPAFPAVPKIAAATLALTALVIFYLGILPARTLDWAAASVGSIF
jgi:hypothetical protein